MRRAEIRLEYAWLALCLIVQAVLLTHRLNLLPMWGDELFTVQAAQEPVGKLVDMVRGDVHPPLYFLLAHSWIRITSGDVLVRLRLLSVLLALLATVALDRLWFSRAPRGIRLWCLALWSSSSCLLLYSRMARSYSLQVLLFIVVCWAALRWSEKITSASRLLIWVGSLAALLYTHYVPGIAAWAGCMVLLSRGREMRRLLIANAIVWVAYLPWLATLASVVSIWQHKPGLLLVTDNRILETGLKLGYWVFSFLYGEAIPAWMLPVSALLAIPVLWLLWMGAKVARDWVAPAVVMAVIGFGGVAGWVSYAFGPARLLFLLPVVLLAIAAGVNYAPRLGTVIAGALLAANLVGIASYFGARDLLNIGYLAPMESIARDIADNSSPADTLVLVDGANLSGSVLEYYLPGFTTRQISTAQDADAARLAIANPGTRRVWFLRNPHDVTPGHIMEHSENDLLRVREGSLHRYTPFSPTQKALMRAANIQVSTDWLYAAWEFRDTKR